MINLHFVITFEKCAEIIFSYFTNCLCLAANGSVERAETHRVWIHPQFKVSPAGSAPDLSECDDVQLVQNRHLPNGFRDGAGRQPASTPSKLY